jgi:hypothetical protein
MSIKPHDLFGYWTPDEVAECMGGVDDDLYVTLWGLVEFYDEREKPETPDTFYGHVFGNDLALPRFWNRLDDADKLKLNELAKRHEDE